MTRRTDTRWLAPLLALPFAAILFLHARRYWPFISDDALISLRYAARLLDGYGLTWTAGHPVEGYSNVLWVLAVAALGALGMDLIAASRLLGALGMTIVLIAVAGWCLRRDPLRVAWLPIVLALLFLALGGPIAVWTIGGLEQPLVAALLAWSVPLTFDALESEGVERRVALRLSLPLGLLCLTRPDAPLFAATAAMSIAAVSVGTAGARVKRAAVVLLWPVVLSAGQLIFRLLYYGEWVPNTALVKITPSREHWLFGWQYLSGGLAALAPWSYIAIGMLVVLVMMPASRRNGIYLLATAVCWAGYVGFIGGDVFPAYRHFIPLMVLLAFAIAEGGRLAARALAHKPRYFYPLAAVALLLFVPYVNNQLADRQNARAIRERWEWDCRELGMLLKTAFSRQQPLVAVTAAGCLPYWSELPSLDMLGLNDHYLPRHPPPDIGAGFIGHELGDGKYVLSREPDLIVFSVGSGPAYRSGEELAAMAEFNERYVPVPFEVPGVDYPPMVYVDRKSRKVGVGITRSPSTVTIPGFLFTAPGAVARLHEGRKLVASPAAGEPVHVTFASDEPLAGWAVEVRSSPADCFVGELQQEGRAVTVTIRSRPEGPVDGVIEEVVLRRSR